MGVQVGSGPDDIPLNLYRVTAPAKARVLATVRLTPSGSDEVRHITIDLSGLDFRFLEGQSLGVIPPGLDTFGRQHKVRLYSIASSRLGDDGRGKSAALCVKRVCYTDTSSRRLHRGVASNHLCDLKVGDEVAITGPAGKSFLLPHDSASNLILVATGTGIAPFRAFLKRIYLEVPDWKGEVRLFFGVRTQAECLYRAELEAFRDRPGFQLTLAFSSEQSTAGGQRMHVQHKMAERIDDLRALLEYRNSYVYVCGVKGTDDGVKSVFEKQPLDAPPLSDWWEALRSAGRIRVETY